MLGTLVPWVGKLTGTMIFESILERVGYRNIMYIVGVIQIIALIGEYSPSYPWMKSPSSIASREEYATDSRVVEMTSHDWRVFSLGRVIAYLAVGMVENAVPSYQAEISPAPLRGFFAGSIMIVTSIGNLWGTVMSRAYVNETRPVGWLVPVGVQSIPAVAMLVTIPFCVGEFFSSIRLALNGASESPRWLISKGKKERAIKAMDLMGRP